MPAMISPLKGDEHQCISMWNCQPDQFLHLDKLGGKPDDIAELSWVYWDKAK